MICCRSFYGFMRQRKSYVCCFSPKRLVFAIVQRARYTHTQTMLRKFEFLLFRNVCVATIISSLTIHMDLSPTLPQHAISCEQWYFVSIDFIQFSFIDSMSSAQTVRRNVYETHEFSSEIKNEFRFIEQRNLNLNSNVIRRQPINLSDRMSLSIPRAILLYSIS